MQVKKTWFFISNCKRRTRDQSHVCREGGGKNAFFQRLRTHKVSDGAETPVLVLLQKARQQRADGVGLPRRQLQRLVQDPVVHFPDVAAVERRLKESGEGGGQAAKPEAQK